MSRNFFRRKKPIEPGPRRGRMLATSIVMALAFLALIGNAWNIQVRNNEHFLDQSRQQHETVIKVKARRGDILDRSGRELAMTAMMPSVFANPRRIEDPAAEARRLAPILDVDSDSLQKKLSSKRAFVWLSRHVSNDVAQKIRELKQPKNPAQKYRPIDLKMEPRRFYPAGAAAGHLLGFTDIDGNGLEGLERLHETSLQGREYLVDGVTDARGRKAAIDGAVPIERLQGHSLETTIDLPIQQACERAIARMVDEMDAKAALMVVMDPKTGDIVAMAQTPTFNPNEFRRHKPADWRNRAVTDVFEPGSVVKPITVAAALDAGSSTASSLIDGHKGRYRVGWKVFEDVHVEEQMTPLDVIKWSSNVGAIQLAHQLGKETHHAYLRAFGLGRRTGLNWSGEQRGSVLPLRRWKKVEHATISFGHGVSTTPIQITSAIGAIANGGLLMKPRLVKRIIAADGSVVQTFEPQITRRVVSEAVAGQVTRGMVMVTESGTARKHGRVPGYKVAGKTGTAHKLDLVVGGYIDDAYLSSFVGFAPAENPRLVAYVVVDEPTKAKYGSDVAAPAFSEVMRMALPYLGIKATQSHSEPAAIAEPEDDSNRKHLPQERAWWRQQVLVPGGVAQIPVPDVIGQSLAKAVKILVAAGLEVEVDGAGVVTEQSPPPGASVDPKTIVAVALTLPGSQRRTK